MMMESKFETGIAAASLVIGLSIALAWLVKNHRERKEMLEMTEKAIKQHLSNKKNNTIVEKTTSEESISLDSSPEIEEKEIVEEVIEEEEEVEEEELDEFELRLRRLGNYNQTGVFVWENIYHHRVLHIRSN